MILPRIDHWFSDKKNRNYLYILGVLILTFIISANIAWLNPNPNYVIKTNEKVPVMWQYNGDSTVEFLSAAYFPEYFKIDKTRTNRPTYPLLAHILAWIYGFILSPIIKLGVLAKTMLGYITLKIAIYSTGALAFYSIIKRFFAERIALTSTILLLLHPFAINFIATFHTSELQFITPIIVLWMWLNLKDSYSHKKNILFSLIVGCLMLAKQNYAIYLSVLVFSLFFSKKYKEVTLSFLIQLIPTLLWLFTLKLINIPYYNHEIAVGQGVWMYEDLIFRNPLEIVQTILLSIQNFIVAIVQHFSIILIPVFYALNTSEVKTFFQKNTIKFTLIFITLLWLQTFAANRYNPYMTSDISFLVFPLASVGLFYILKRFKKETWIKLFCIIYLIVGLIQMIHFPWIHPYDQKNIISNNSKFK